ncbi:class I SAM-dependent methyltransferase [Marinibacterium profundimaris]|uniref:Phosphatidylethanolamine N-methyltransferase n=1 Tax=Marinibacterium profundimaris TaxID=1679460 RepID=A0A225NF12_9RHOB|nr:methyltransferase domain-containing protein [Marinibacterium profundimaris]OWU71001.1 phosphatidylethanolamine N-methyltransferase [Marinibacterium profundimaris]
MEIQAVANSYARWAPVYDQTFGAVTQSGRRAAVGLINQGEGSVLEVGVGTGLALDGYAPHLDVTGIDFSQDMLDKAQERVEKKDLSHVSELRQMDARRLDFPDDHFDSVAAMHVLSVVPEPERVMSEIARVCKPGGKVVITNHFQRDTGVLARIERMAAPLSNVLGWHSDFEMVRILQEPRLSVTEKRGLPPLGMMTLLVLEKS